MTKADPPAIPHYRPRVGVGVGVSHHNVELPNY